MIRALLARARRRDQRKRARPDQLRPGLLEQTLSFPTAIITGPPCGDPIRDPIGTRRWANPRDPHPWSKIGRDRWQHLGSLAIRRDHQVASFKHDRELWWPFDWSPPAPVHGHGGPPTGPYKRPW